ncbi:hypothetical protein [Mobilicoccus massiliensis]|uniref:hypothetical protein n=1 Tax=Mobilicoccus massiliensis TaxID=1522310 RepID=UPI00058FAA59|nr:hypothetical protein [Mobilicoccus massiliensis]
MTHGLGHRLTRATLVTLVALAPAVATTAAPPASAASNDPLVTVTDGCGRVDSLTIDSGGRYWLQLLPDGKAAATSSAKPQLEDPVEDWAKYYGYIEFSGSWRRTSDLAKSYLLVRVLKDDGVRSFKYVSQVLAGAEGTAIRGTDQTKLTNEDCVQPEEPTFTDEEGSANDTVTIPSTPGVKYSGKPGVTPGKGTVTVTATAEKGFRLADEDGVPLPVSATRWTHTFDGTSPVEVPRGKAPAFRRGATIPASKGKPAGRGPNVVIVRYVPGVAWVVDGKQVKVTEKQTIVEVPVGDKASVEVQAVSADPKAFALSGETEWVVGMTPSTKPAAPRVVAAPGGVNLRKSPLTWSPAPGFPSYAKHNVRYRVVTLTKNNVRASAPWRPWLQETTLRNGLITAKPGTVIEVTAQSVANRRVSAWSAPTTVWFPLDVKGGGAKKFWTLRTEPGAIGSSMYGAHQRTSAWTTKTPTTNKVLLWFGTAPNGAPAAVYVDGKRVATVQTKAPRVRSRQMLKAIPVLWGKHVVTVVHAGKNGQTLRMDGVAYGR